MLSNPIYNEEQKQIEKQITQEENKRSNECHLNSMRNQTILNQSNFERRDREE